MKGNMPARFGTHLANYVNPLVAPMDVFPFQRVAGLLLHFRRVCRFIVIPYVLSVEFIRAKPLEAAED